MWHSEVPHSRGRIPTANVDGAMSHSIAPITDPGSAWDGLRDFAVVSDAV